MRYRQASGSAGLVLQKCSCDQAQGTFVVHLSGEGGCTDLGIVYGQGSDSQACDLLTTEDGNSWEGSGEAATKPSNLGNLLVKDGYVGQIVGCYGERVGHCGLNHCLDDL